VTAAPASGTRLCALSEIPDPGAKGFEFREGDQRFAGFVVRKNGAVFGYVDSCPHVGWPLAMFDRYLTRDKDLIVCSGHGALFRIQDGLCLAGPCPDERLTAWPVRVNGDGIFVA
jgi:nitrite reductase/ring-hydroxylating ferredoxin subunit